MGIFPTPARLLDALFVVDIHVQISAVLLGQGNALVVNHGRMFDGSHAGTDCILDALGRVRMRCHTQPEMTGFVHRGLQLLRSKLLRFRIAAMGQHGPAGENFDMVRAVMHQLANFLSHFPRTIGLSIAKVPWQRDVGRKPSHGARAAGDGHVRAGHKHAWTFDEAVSNRVAHGYIIQRPVNADIAHRGEAFSQKSARIGNRSKCSLRCSHFQLQKGITVLVGRVRQVGVAIDEAGQHGHLRKIYDLGVSRNRQTLADLLNLVVADENDLIVEHGAGLRIN